MITVVSTVRGLPGKISRLASRCLQPSGILKRADTKKVTPTEGSRWLSSGPLFADDDYPTRFVKEPVVLPRTDPTVWGCHAQGGLLTAEDMEHYDRYGFVVLPDVFKGRFLQELTEDVMSRRDEAERDLDPANLENGLGHSRSCTFLTEAQSNRLRIMGLTFRHIPLVNQLARYPPLLTSVKQILDDDVYISQDRVNFHAAFDGKGFYWHSDFETWHSEDGMPRPRSLTAMVMLTDNAPHNGALMVMPGSHRHFVGCVGQRDENYGTVGTIMQRQYLGLPDRAILAEFQEKYGITYCTGKAGTLVLTDCNVIHGSHTNISPRDRCNVFAIYNSLTNRCGKPYSGSPERLEFLSTQDSEWIKPVTEMTIRDYDD